MIFIPVYTTKRK